LCPKSVEFRTYFKMGCCGTLCRILGFVLIPLIASLVYFHLECLEEEKNQVKPQFNEKFDLQATDITVQLNFNIKGQKHEIYLGLAFMCSQWMNCAVMKLLVFLTGAKSNFDQIKSEPKNVTILDARKHQLGKFHETGFTLIELDQESEVKDWRTNGGLNADENAEIDVKKFHKQFEPYLKKLYPKVKRIVWTHNVVRGGHKFLDQPVALGPHLDYYQGKEERIAFHQRYPPLTWTNMSTEAGLLMGSHDTENSKLGVLLGVWKPIFPYEVCDHPLAIMDARTFSEEDEQPNELHGTLGLIGFNNLNGAISHSAKQKWYYYSYQNTREVLVFHQYSEGNYFANPHSSFFNKNCPKDTQARQSVEFRVGLFF